MERQSRLRTLSRLMSRTPSASERKKSSSTISLGRKRRAKMRMVLKNQAQTRSLHWLLEKLSKTTLKRTCLLQQLKFSHLSWPASLQTMIIWRRSSSEKRTSQPEKPDKPLPTGRKRTKTTRSDLSYRNKYTYK